MPQRPWQPIAMKIDRIAIFIFPLLMAATPALSQYDLQYRGSLSLRQDLPKKFVLDVGYQVRTDQMMGRFSGSYISAELKRELHKYLTAEAEFRYGTSTRFDNFRYSLGLSTDVKVIKKLRAGADLRYQYVHYLQEWAEIGQNPARHQIRLKVGVDVRAHKKIGIALSTEPMFRISANEAAFRRLRTQATVKFDLPKRFTLSVGAFYQNRLDDPTEDALWAVVTAIRFDLPKKWWKSKKKAADKE